MVRLVDKPHQVALRVVGFEDRNLSDTLGFPASKRELLDRLQVKLVVFSDRIEVNALLPIQPIDIQLCILQGEGDTGDRIDELLPGCYAPVSENVTGCKPIPTCRGLPPHQSTQRDFDLRFLNSLIGKVARQHGWRQGIELLPFRA